MSKYVGECLRKDEEFILYRARASGAEERSVLLLTPASTRPTIESLKKINNEYSFRDDLDTTWAVRPLALSEYNGQKALVLEDAGGEPLHCLIQGPMEIHQFLRIAIGLAGDFCEGLEKLTLGGGRKGVLRFRHCRWRLSPTAFGFAR